MKMKQKRQGKYPFKHTCSCLGDHVLYMEKLPKEKDECVNAKYFKRVKGDKWVEVEVG